MSRVHVGFRAIVATSVLLFAAGCGADSSGPSGTDDGTSLSPTDGKATIGTAGGSVALTSGNPVSVTVPAGALNGSTDLSITRTSVISLVTGIAGSYVHLEPDGTTFNSPASLRMTPPATLPPNVSPSDLTIAVKDGLTFELVPSSFNPSTGKVEGSISHFSDYFLSDMMGTYTARAMPRTAGGATIISSVIRLNSDFTWTDTQQFSESGDAGTEVFGGTFAFTGSRNTCPQLRFTYADSDIGEGFVGYLWEKDGAQYMFRDEDGTRVIYGRSGGGANPTNPTGC